MPAIVVTASSFVGCEMMIYSSSIFRVCQSNPTDKNEKEEGRKGRKERATERDLLRRLCVVSFLLLIVVAIVIRLLAY
jgi:hypothetical protein